MPNSLLKYNNASMCIRRILWEQQQSKDQIFVMWKGKLPLSTSSITNNQRQFWGKKKVQNYVHYSILKEKCIWKSQNCLDLKGTLRITQSIQFTPSRLGHWQQVLQDFPFGFWTFPVMEVPQLLWGTTASGWQSA